MHGEIGSVFWYFLLFHDESWYQLKHGLQVWAICFISSKIKAYAITHTHTPTLSRLQSCRAYMLSTADAADAGRPDRKDCASIILVAAEAATQSASDAIQVIQPVEIDVLCQTISPTLQI